MARMNASSTDQVLAAATRVFLAKGFQGSTIDDIARAANISKPTVYQYAKSKQWLMDRIVEIVCDVLSEGQMTILNTPAPPAVRLQWLIRLNIELATTYRSSYRLSLDQQTDLSPEARDNFRLWARGVTTRFAELLSACRQEGTLTWEGDILHAANLIQAMLSSTHRWFHPSSEDDYEQLLGEVCGLLSGALTVPDMSDWPMPEVPSIATSPLTN